MSKTLGLALAAILLSTSAFALQPRQPTGEAGKANLAAFQAWVKQKQPAHVSFAPGCKPPVWTSACGRTPDNGLDRDGSGGDHGDNGRSD